MDTDAHGSGFICVHPCSSVVILLSALTRPLITVGSSAWSGEFGVYEPFDAEALQRTRLLRSSFAMSLRFAQRPGGRVAELDRSLRREVASTTAERGLD